MARLNPNYNKLQSAYVFSDIAKKTAEFQKQNPSVKIYKLGIGDTTQPLPDVITCAMKVAVDKLGKKETYSGYGVEQGSVELRLGLVDFYKVSGIALDVDEVFISDGAKPDSANILSIFAADSKIAVSDPVYPVYVDTSVISGLTGEFKNGRYAGIEYMPAKRENGFFPDIPDSKVDVIYICSPNNPTGATATHAQLKKLVEYARENKAIIIFDSAYSAFIADPTLPKSIYEIEGASTCAIEIGSFSKWAGFPGVRLGWSIVPKSLVVEGASENAVNKLWTRRQTTMFNGASIISQAGGLAVLTPEGLSACQQIIDYYMENAKIIREGIKEAGLEVYGGENAPYLWVAVPDGTDSWGFFDTLLNNAHVVTTPGPAFGPRGEGYIRLTAFGDREDTINAIDSIKNNLNN